MAKSHLPATTPDTVWLARGRHSGPAPEKTLRENLRALKTNGVIDDFLEPEPEDPAEAPERVFEARWRAAGVTVRARLTVGAADRAGDEHDWVLVAEAERPWDPAWPSPATMFWPEDGEAAWDRDGVGALRLRDINPLPRDDKALRRLLRDSVRHSWSINVVVHEAMTPDERGRRPLSPLLPPGLRHRVVEHRATPDQYQIANWALDDFGVRLPRGGAVVLPGTPAPPGYTGKDFSVRSVFLDGSEPRELLDAIERYAALPLPSPEGAQEAVTALREKWHLVTLEEELAHTRALVETYKEALEAMTASRDLYREAAELAHAALAETKETQGVAPPAGDRGAQGPQDSPLHQLTRTFQRMTDTFRAKRASGEGASSAGAFTTGTFTTGSFSSGTPSSGASAPDGGAEGSGRSQDSG